MASVIVPATAYQREFLCAVEDDYYSQIGYGGARGGGKTFISCFGMVTRRLRYEATRGLMLRQTQGAADQNLGEEIQKVLRLLGVPFGPGTPVYYHVSKKQWHFPNGSYIQLGYCKGETDWQRYQGMQYTDIAFEEATQFKERAFLDIVGSNRTDNPKAQGKVWITCNPGGIGTAWVNRRFIDPLTRDRRTHWIKALLRHNQALLENDPGYRDRTLAKQPDWRRRQWEDGDWESVEGQFFVVPETVFRTVDVPYWAEVYAGVDAGYYPSAFAVVYVAKWQDFEGKTHLHVWREVKRQKLNVREQAEEALAVEEQLPITVRARFADPAAWKRTEAEGGINATTAHGWARNAFIVTAAYSNARSAGWLLLRTVIDDGILTIDPGCMALRAEMAQALHSEKNDDIDPRCEDHLLDALRYCLVSTFAGAAPGNTDNDPYARIVRKKLVRDKRTVVLTKGDQ